MSVNLASRKSTGPITLIVSPSLRKVLTVEAPTPASLTARTLHDVHFRASAVGIKKPGLYWGEITVVADAAKHKAKRRVLAALPVVIRVKKGASNTFSDVTYYQNSANPMLLSLKLASQEKITIFGSKAEDGTAESLTGMSVEKEGKRSHIELAPSGQISRALLADGSVLTFTWSSQTNAIVSVLSPDGKAQANVEIDTTSAPQSSTSLASSDPEGMKALASVLSGDPAKRVYDFSQVDTGKQSGHESQLALQAASSSTLLTVTVTSDGKPESGATVYAHIIPKILGPEHLGYVLPLNEVGPGSYATSFANFPSDLVSPTTVLEKCNSAVEAVSTWCPVIGPVASWFTTVGCIRVAAAIAPLVTPAIAAGVLGACEGLFAAAGGFCAVVNAPPDGANPAVCNAIAATINFLDPDGVYVRARASKAGRSAEGVIDVGGSQAAASIALQLPTPPCSIQDFSTNPVDPGPFQGYIATAVTTCTAPETSISMRISGTDGYSDSSSCTGTDICQLPVPGADEGIVDTITVETSSGETRSIVLVF